MIKTTYIIAILIFFMGSCGQKVQENTSALEQETEKMGIAKVVRAESICNEFSGAMVDLIDLLKKDNYNIESIDNDGKLEFRCFNKDAEFKIDTCLSVSKGEFKSFFAKRKHKLERMEDNWYPSFSVTEICFRDEQTASTKYQEISQIIDKGDMINEKIYDYILKNESRLIYVRCGAKIFEEYAFDYKGKIEEIIENNKR